MPRKQKNEIEELQEIRRYEEKLERIIVPGIIASTIVTFAVIQSDIFTGLPIPEPLIPLIPIVFTYFAWKLSKYFNLKYRQKREIAVNREPHPKEIQAAMLELSEQYAPESDSHTRSNNRN